MKSYTFTAHFTPTEEGGYLATVPALPGCISQGESLEEAKTNIKEAMELYIESLLADGEDIPDEKRLGIVREELTVTLEAA